MRKAKHEYPEEIEIEIESSKCQFTQDPVDPRVRTLGFPVQKVSIQKRQPQHAISIYHQTNMIIIINGDLRSEV